jgi:hypothetical protein
MSLPCLAIRCSGLPQLAFAALLAFAGCDDNEMELPTPPDLSALVAAYENPTGTVAPQDVSCIGQAALDRVLDDRLEPLRDLVADALSTLRQRMQASGLPTDTAEPIDEDEPRLRGVVHVERICRGWDPQATAPDPDRNGRIDLNALVHGSMVPVVWGQATACQGRVGQGGPATLELYLNASLEIFLYRGLVGGGPPTFLLALHGEYGIDGERWPVNWDFRMSASSIDLRIARDDGDLVASVGGGRVELQTRDGAYVFDPATSSCNN